MANQHIYYDRTRPRGDWLGLSASAEGLFWTIRQRLCRLRGPLAGCLSSAGAPMAVKDIAVEVRRPRRAVRHDLKDLIRRGLMEIVPIGGRDFYRVVGFKADQARIGRSRIFTPSEIGPIECSQQVTGQNPVQNGGKMVGDNPVDNFDPLWISTDPLGKSADCEFCGDPELDPSEISPIPTSQRVTGQNPVQNDAKKVCNPLKDKIGEVFSPSENSPIERSQRVTGQNPVQNGGEMVCKTAGPPISYHMIRSTTTTKPPARPSGVPPSPPPSHPDGYHHIESHRSSNPIDHPITSTPTDGSGGTPEGRAGNHDTQAALVADIVAFVHSDQYEPAFGSRVATLDGFPDGLRIARAQFDRVKAECVGPQDKRPANPGSRIMSYFNKEITRQTILTGRPA